MITKFEPSGLSSHRRQPVAIKLNDSQWWHFAAIAVFLAAGLGGVAGAREAALATAGFLAVTGLMSRTGSKSFRALVQFTYLGLMALSFLPGLGFIAWIQMAGTFVLVLTGYCPLARVLLLLIKCRSGLSWNLVRQVLLSPPVAGSISEKLDLRQAQPA